MGLYQVIRIDFKNNSFRSAITLAFYRLMHYLYLREKSLFVRTCLKIIKIIWGIFKIVLGINSQISYKAEIGSGIRLPHIGEGVIISAKAQIGNNVTIYHQVTIGINEKLTKIDDQKIIIGDNSYISAGAKIISCKVGANVSVGPNAVVYTDVEDKKKVFVQNIMK